MKRIWLRMAAIALALAGAALAGCEQQGGRQPEYPIFQPTQSAQPDGAAITAPMQQAAPAKAATATETTAALTPGPLPGKADTRPASVEPVEKAKADLAKKLGIPTSEIAMISVIGQEFSANAFYCRATKDRVARDESPTVISGYSILLNVSGHRYEYHASGQTVIYCRPLD